MYDALLVLSFGGPEGPDEVMPFLERVTKGRGVPPERLVEVAAHYHHFGGVSPIGARTRELVDAIRVELAAQGPRLPVYSASRFSAPTMTDVLRIMQADGVRRALGLVTSAFGSYSGCRAYLDALASARAQLGEGAPRVDALRPFSGHRGYVETCTERLRDALDALPGPARVLFSAHSIPVAMAAGSAYVAELETLASRVASALALPEWELVYQSRSGPPEVPWLEPDVRDAMRAIARDEPGATVVIAPFGFVADHMEVVFDLDVEARIEAEHLGLRFARAASANAHPRFVTMVRELVEEALREGAVVCPADCCPAPRARRSVA